MSSSGKGHPALFFDFDNTIALRDVLDDVIERYSVTEAWRDWEDAWREGRITTLECLSRQVGDLRLSREDLLEFVSDIPVDPAFREIAAWASARDVPLKIVSDSFTILIREILRRRGIENVDVCANSLTFVDDRIVASFPWRDAECLRCAHCKAQHLRRLKLHETIYVGDGLSDLCPAMIADIVFAKDALAEELTSRGLRFRPFGALSDIVEFLHSSYDLVLAK